MTTLQMLQRAIESRANMNAIDAWNTNSGDVQRFLAQKGISLDEAELIVGHLKKDGYGVTTPPTEFVEIMRQKVIDKLLSE